MSVIKKEAYKIAYKILKKTVQQYSFLHTALAYIEVITVVIAISLFLYVFYHIFYVNSQINLSNFPADMGKPLVSLGGALCSGGVFVFAGKKRKLYWKILEKARKQLIEEFRDIHVTTD